MKNFYITTDQKFKVTYAVQAETREQAWALLLEGSPGTCENVEQEPVEIIGSFGHADIMEG